MKKALKKKCICLA